MRKWIVVTAVVTVAAVAIFRGGAKLMEISSGARAWPRGLGSLRDVPARFPPVQRNAAATQLMTLASRAGVNLEPGQAAPHGPDELRAALNGYVRLQLERRDDGIDAPPPRVTAYLAQNEVALDAVRDHLRAQPAVEWGADVSKGFAAPLPNLLGHVQIERALIVRALEKARRGDPSAWLELEASWELSKVLWRRPELVSRLIALGTTRMMNAAARKMPGPLPPPWFAATRSLDAVRAMSAAQQAEAWRIREYAGEDEAVQQLPAALRIVVAPLHRLEAALAADSIRTFADRVAASGACDLASVRGSSPREMPELASAFQRTLRYRAEVEATDRVLQMRRGGTPPATSQCSDATWVITADGFELSRLIPVASPALHVPLAYKRQRSGPNRD